MALKTKVVTITREGRDRGKTFLISEMDAMRAEGWAWRMLHVVMSAGIQVPDGIFSMGMAGVSILGLRALQGIRWEDVKPLHDELLSCVQTVPDSHNMNVVRALDVSDVDEPLTLMILKSEVFELHTGFSIAGAVSKSLSAPAASDQPESSTTPTSHAQSAA